MPDTEGTVKYRVELDDSDIGAQLDSIREKIDTALGTTSFNPVDVSKITPTQLPFPEIPAAPPPSNFANQLDSQFWQNVNSTAGSDVHGAINRIGEKIDYVMAGMYGGVNRAVQDFQGFFPGGPAYTVPQQAVPGITADPGLWNDMLRTYTPFSGGFTYTGSITPGEMRRQSSDRMNQRFFDLTTNYGITAGATLGGAWLGSVIPGAGTLAGASVGFTVGSTLDFVQDILSRRAVEREQIGAGILAISRTNGIGIGSEAAETFAGELQTMFSSAENRARGFDITTAERAMLEFTNAGGYTYTRGLDEFKQTTLDLLKNYKRVAADLNIEFEEAQRWMAMLNQNFIANPTQAGIAASQIKGIAGMAGLDPMEIANFAMQGAMTLGATGMGREAGYMMALDSRYQAERLAQFGNLEARKLVADAGGPAGFAEMMMGTLTNWGMGDMGALSMAAMLGGYGGGSLAGLFGGAAGFIGGDPARLFALQAQQAKILGQLGSQGTDLLNLMALDPIVSLGNIMGLGRGPEGKIPADVLVGLILSTNPGMRSDQAWAMVTSGFGTGASHERQAVYETLKSIQTEIDITEPIPWYADLWYKIGGAVADWLDSSEWINKQRKNIRTGVRDVIDDANYYLTGRRTIRYEDYIKDPRMQQGFKEFQNSQYIKNLETRVDTFMNNLDTESGKRELKEMAIFELDEFLNEFGDTRGNNMPGLSRVLYDNPTIREAFALGTLGGGFEGKLKIAKQVYEQYRAGVAPEAIIRDLQYTGESQENFGYDKSSKEYKEAMEQALSNPVDPSMLLGYSSKEARELLSKIYFTKSYDELSPNYKEALYTVAGRSGEMRKLLAEPRRVSPGQLETSVRRAKLLQDAKTFGAEINSDIDSSEKYIKEHLSEEISELGIPVLIDQPYAKDIMGEVEKTFRLLRNRETSPERILERLAFLTDKGGADLANLDNDERKEYFALSASSSALRKYNVSGDRFSQLIHIETQAKIEKDTQDNLARKRIREILAPGSQDLATQVEREALVQKVLNDTPGIVYGTLSEEERQEFGATALTQMEAAKLTDAQIAVARRHLLSDVSMSPLITTEAIKRMGTATSLDNAKSLALIDLMYQKVQSGEGVPVTMVYNIRPSGSPVSQKHTPGNMPGKRDGSESTIPLD